MSAETYTPGTDASAVSFMARRRATTHAAFLLPHLRPGMRLLDIGCGPGTITRDLARAIAPGEAIGIDRSEEQLEAANAQARREAVNASFRRASVYELPFAAGGFDAVFSHALFEHLGEPDRALGEIARVLRPGGIVALRSPDWGGFLLHPDSAGLRGAVARYEALQDANGGDTRAGRKLASRLRAACFTGIVRSASYETYPDARLIAEYLARQLERADAADAATTLRDWARDPDAMFAQAWVEAIGVR